MQSALLSSLREQVDGLRSSVQAGEIRLESAESILKSSSASMERRPSRSELDSQHSGRGVHMCPWNTCAATRHG
jgi:hypothetical protein